jgi:hypothetical protein
MPRRMLELYIFNFIYDHTEIRAFCMPFFLKIHKCLTTLCSNSSPPPPPPL